VMVSGVEDRNLGELFKPIVSSGRDGKGGP
jgi:hypothetical protein